MRDKSTFVLFAVMSAFALSGLAAVAFSGAEPAPGIQPPGIQPDPARPSVTPRSDPGADVPMTAGEWLSSMRPYCNPIDVETRLAWSPAPETADGTMHEAACLALSGRVDDARARLLTLSEQDRWRGAGVVFEVGHPAADAGDDVAAGPLMELVVEFWPNHYMALYHAGAARFESGDPTAAEEYLERFLVEYEIEDGWRRNALAMLSEIGG